MWLPFGTRGLKDHLVPTACCGQQRAQALGQVAQGATQAELEHPSGRGVHSVCGQPVPAPQPLVSGKGPLDVLIFLMCACEVSLHWSAYKSHLVEQWF